VISICRGHLSVLQPGLKFVQWEIEELGLKRGKAAAVSRRFCQGKEIGDLLKWVGCLFPGNDSFQCIRYANPATIVSTEFGPAIPAAGHRRKNTPDLVFQERSDFPAILAFVEFFGREGPADLHPAWS
jgi:hypothetical protein